MSSNITGVDLDRFAQTIKEAMKREGWTQSKLAGELDVDQSYISQLCRPGNKKRPASDLVFMLANALKLDRNELESLLGRQGKSVSRRPVVIGIAGPSAAGKSWFLSKLIQRLPKSITAVSLDHFYRELKEVEKLDFTFDHPDAIDHAAALKALVQLKDGRETVIPNYDYDTASSKGRTQVKKPNSIIVFEGHLLFHQSNLRSEFDLKIWIQADDETLMTRRYQRDLDRTTRTLPEIIGQYRDKVRPAFEKFLREHRRYADVVLVNDGSDPDRFPVFADMLIEYIRNLPYAPILEPREELVKPG